MNSILKLIIVPFKLPKYINSCNSDIMNNKHPYIKHYLTRNYCKFSSVALNEHPIMAELILKKQIIFDPSRFSNPSPLLTKFLIKEFKLTPSNLYYLTLNNNPELAEFIILKKNHFNNKCWCNIGGNSNPGLTNFIRENYFIHRKNYRLSSNTNPEIADLILLDPYPTFELSTNPNTGLTNFLLNSTISVKYNTNPALAPLIMSLTPPVYENSNVGLTDFILSNPPTTALSWNRLALNTNPGLEKFIYENKNRISEDSLYNLASNRYIFKKIEFITLM